MLYGALPGTVTGRLSVPHQKPGGPSPAGRADAAVAARAAVAGAWLSSSPVTRSSAMQPPAAARARHGSCFVIAWVQSPLAGLPGLAAIRAGVSSGPTGVRIGVIHQDQPCAEADRHDDRDQDEREAGSVHAGISFRDDRVLPRLAAAKWMALAGSCHSGRPEH